MDWNGGDFFQRKISNSRAFGRKKKSGNTRIWLITILIILWFCYFFFQWNQKSEEWEEWRTIEFRNGETVSFQWELKADGDIITHTHTINTQDHGIIFLKSKEINLWEYHGEVTITGNVTKIYQNKPIVEVSSISGEKTEKIEDVDIILDKNSGVYFLSAWIHFLPEFFDEYVFLNEWENGEIQIQNLTTDQKITINYFRCNDSDPHRNCKQLVESFSQSSRSFITSNGDTYYKESEINSWFISNGNRWGIFINDVPEEEVMMLKDYIVFVNEKVMKTWLDFSATRICQDEEESLQKITDHEYYLKQEGLMATISWVGEKYNLTCEVQIDFSLPKKGKLLSLTKNGEKKIENESKKEENKKVKDEEWTKDKEEKENTKKEEKSEEKKTDIEQQESNRNPNVKQFPLKENSLTYTAKQRNYILDFPSSQISFVVNSVKENFWKENISCNFVINIINYTNKEMLDESPDIKIYECKLNEDISAQDLWVNYVIKNEVDKTFIIQINNPAWVDFANAVKFEYFESE